jgi:hypothetical protein
MPSLFSHKSKKVKQSFTGLNRPRGCIQLQLSPFMTSVLEGGVWSLLRPGRLTSGKDPVPIVQEAVP